MESSENVEIDVLSTTSWKKRKEKSSKLLRGCEFCPMAFKARTTLYKHVLKQHPEEWSLKQIKKQMERKYQCKFCHCKFRYKNSLTCHLKKMHRNDLILSGYCPDAEETKRRTCRNFCKEQGCRASFSSVEQLKKHLTNAHFIEIKTANITFKSFSEFEEWRQELEKNTTRFMPRMRWPRADGGFSRLYKCMRSGVYCPTVSEENRKRRLKTEGSYKIGQHCPAQLTVVHYPTGVTSVKACLTHYGHEFNGKYTLGYNKNKSKKKRKDYIGQRDYSGVNEDDGQEQELEDDHEILTSSLATKANLRDQAKDLCGFLQGLLTTTEVSEDHLEQIINNLNTSVALAGWKPTQESQFVPVDVVHSVREIEAHEGQEQQAQVHRIVSDTSKNRNHSHYEHQEIKPKLEQQEVVQEYLITETPYEQYIVWT